VIEPFAFKNAVFSPDLRQVAIPIIYRLIVLNEPVRFGDLLRAAAPITQKELTKQLRLFEQRGLVTRTIYAEIPPRVEYQITELGLTLQSALTPLADWMREYGDRLKR
jgi:DNA-binding HxlR family transcriptional regulator